MSVHLTTHTHTHLIPQSLPQMGDAGALSVAKALQVNRTLRNLDLTSNEIGDEGATCPTNLDVGQTASTLHCSDHERNNSCNRPDKWKKGVDFNINNFWPRNTSDELSTRLLELLVIEVIVVAVVAAVAKW